MKGTAPRGRTTGEDRQRAEGLRVSRKNRAENVMIVDMIRNDIGKVAKPGSVETASLFDVERYDAVFQLTSTVTGEATGSPVEVLRALFPCASITGAPKVRAMQLIRELEPNPRGVYSGAIGRLAPEGRARFSVAIRTAMVDRAAGSLSYGTGGGIVWDSESGGRVPRDGRQDTGAGDSSATVRSPRDTSLAAGIRLPASRGASRSPSRFSRLLRRPVRSRLDTKALEVHASELSDPRRVRLIVERDGSAGATSAEINETPVPCRLEIASEPIDSADVFLFHKTTNRAAYERAHRDRPGADDVLLWNERGEADGEHMGQRRSGAGRTAPDPEPRERPSGRNSAAATAR